MKIVYVTARLPHGSDEAFVVPEIEQLLRSGHDVLLVPRSPRGVVMHGQELLPRARRESLYSPRVLGAAAAVVLAAPARTLAAVRVLLESRSPAVAIRNLAIVPKALWLAKIAAEWGAEHIHCHWASTTATMTMIASGISGIPWSLTTHRWDIVEDNLLAAKVSSASFVRFISVDGLRMARRIGIGPAGNARVLHMGVTVPAGVQRRYGPRAVVLCPGRLVEVKGHRFLLEAWRMLQHRGVDAELWLAGDGELRRPLQALSATLGLGDSIKFLGAIPHRALLKIYEEVPIAAVVLASVDLGQGVHEGIPVALIEAMGYGLPVVATATGGTPELVIPGAGLLARPADPAALADAMQCLLQDPELRERLGNAARRRVLEAFDVARIATELASEFEAASQPPIATAQCA